jgi:hypothetical protein
VVILAVLAAVAKGTCSGGPGHPGSNAKGVVVVMVAILAAVLLAPPEGVVVVMVAILATVAKGVVVVMVAILAIRSKQS